MEKAMMRILDKVLAWFAEYQQQNRERREARKAARLQREVERRIQVREFDGGLCLCIDNIPVLKRAEFDDAELKQARTLLFNYLTSARR